MMLEELGKYNIFKFLLTRDTFLIISDITSS